MPSATLVSAFGLVAVYSVLSWGSGRAAFGESESVSGQQPTAVVIKHDRSIGYVGAATCRGCHLAIYNSYGRTAMGRSFSPLNSGTSMGEFDESHEVTEGGLTYKVFERDDRFFMQEYVKASNGAPLALEEHELVWVVGSNSHGRNYVIEREGKLFQAPLCWYTLGQRWALCPGFERVNQNFTREITTSCVFCHNGVMPEVAGQRNIFEQPYPHGIGCERCHGPGERHVEHWRSDEAYGQGWRDNTIVNPAVLPPSQSIQICLQCHLGDANQTERIIRHDRTPESFRPGESISAVLVSFRFAQQTQHDFGLSAQADRLMLSRCFTESGGRLECTNCHDPHVSTSETPRDVYTGACANCHATEDCAEEHAARERADKDCVDCHMRRAEPDDQRFSMFTDHWIRRDITFDEKDHRDDFAMEPIFPEEYAKLSAGEQSYYLARALTQQADSVELSGRAWSKMISDATANYAKAIEAGYDTVDSRYHYGKSLLAERKYEASRVQFEAVLKHAPTHRDALFALGQYHGGKGELDRAVALFEQVLAKEPDSAMALAERGRMMFKGGKYAEALELYRQAQDREPWNVKHTVNVGMSLAAGGRMEEAAEQARRAAQLDPDSIEAWSFNMNVLREIGDEKGAAEAGRRLEQLQRR